MMLTTGQRVTTEWGAGTVVASSARRVIVRLDEGGSINVQTGTPGYWRIIPMEPAS